MAYKNDSMLTVVNKYGKGIGDGRTALWETYDQIRDITDGGSAIGGSGLGLAGSAFIKFAQMFSPSSFLPVIGSNHINVPGTSFGSPITGGTAITPGGTSAFNFGNLSKFPSFPNITGSAAPLALSLGVGLGSLFLNSVQGIGASSGSGYSIGGQLTGAAAALTAGNAAGAVAGTAAGAGMGRGIVLPAAGLVAGIGGIASSLGPYFGPFGVAAAAGGSIASGIGGAILNGYQRVSMQVLNNADTILTNKVKNIETTVKQLITQTTIIRKMIKEKIEGEGKALQELL